METYLTLLYVTLEQELALKDFFIEKGWTYCKPDLSVTTDRVGPVENLQRFKKKNGGIIAYSELAGKDESVNTRTTKVATKNGRKKGSASPDVTNIKIEMSAENESTSVLDGMNKDLTDEQTENDDGDNDDDFADDLALNEEENDSEDTNFSKTCPKRTVRNSLLKKEVDNFQGNLLHVPGTSSVDQEECLASGRKRRKVAAKTEAKVEAVMSGEQEEKKDEDSLYDKQYFRSLLIEALKSSPSGKETAKNEFSICPQCRKSIRNTNVRRHLLSHLDLPYRCTRCTLFFKSEAALETHRREKHIGEFVCSYCGMEYRFKNSLTEHIQTRHEGTAKMYECSICGVKMCRKSHMDDHMNVHNNTNPYSCESCSKSYKNKSAYKRHLKDCGSGNKYVCDECGQIYKSATGLQDHLKRCHDKTNSFLFYCLCGNSFKTRAARCRHRLRCEIFQKQKGSKPSLIERNITILRVTTSQKHEISEAGVVSRIKSNESNDNRDSGEVLIVEQPNDNVSIKNIEQGIIDVNTESLDVVH